MSGRNLNTELGPVPDMNDDTRQLAIAGVRRLAPAEHADELLQILGLAEPDEPVGVLYCGCGARIKVPGRDRCATCIRDRKPTRGARRGSRTQSAIGDDL